MNAGVSHDKSAATLAAPNRALDHDRARALCGHDCSSSTLLVLERTARFSLSLHRRHGVHSDHVWRLRNVALSHPALAAQRMSLTGLTRITADVDLRRVFALHARRAQKHLPEEFVPVCAQFVSARGRRKPRGRHAAIAQRAYCTFHI
jgi:hypothetical protein